MFELLMNGRGLLSILLTLVLPLGVLIGHAEEVRTWTDSTGRHETEASFVRASGDSVHLKLVDGRVIALPIARLSNADKEYLARLARPSEISADATALSKAADASVIVWITYGEHSVPAPALVLLRFGGKAYVISDTWRPVSSGGNQPPTYAVQIGDNRVPAERVANPLGNSSAMFAVATEAAPSAMRDIPFAAPSEGLGVRVLGFRTQPGGKSFERFDEIGKIDRVFFSLGGDIAAVRIACPTSPPEKSLVVTEAGQLVGVASKFGGHPIAEKAKEDEEHWYIDPIGEYIARFAKPFFPQRSVSVATREPQTYQFTLDVSDPFNRLRNVRLLVRPLVSDALTLPVEFDPDVLPTDVPPVRLAIQPPGETGSTKPKLSGEVSYVGSIEYQFNTEGLLGFHSQVIYETPDGETFHGSFQGSLLPGAGR